MVIATSANRKLAAILVSDIVGYSKLMGADEESTLAALRSFQNEILMPGVAGHRGRVVKSLGDGWLVEFSSAVAAVNCAMQMQDRLAESQTFSLRIGVHIGDIVYENDDIYGDGVNVASRLEGLASPGGIAVSEAVYSSLDGTMSPSFDFTGEQSLKNISRPIRVWSRNPPEGADAEPGVQTSAETRQRHRGFPKLSVAPLAASDPRIEVKELADAITNDLGLYFAALGWLSFQVTEAPDTGEYALRGALRSRGDRLRLEVSLTDPAGQAIWTNRFDGDLSDSFDWQDQVSEEITSNVIGFVFDSEIEILSRIERDDRTAEQCFLHGLMRRNSMTEVNFIEALTDYSLAIEKDPELTDAYAEAIFFAIGGRTMGLGEQLEPFQERHSTWMQNAKGLKHKTAALDLCVATASFFKDRNTEPLKLKIGDVLRRAPFDVKTLVFSGWGSNWCGDAQIALDCFQKVEQLACFSPYGSIAQGGLGLANLLLENDKEALKIAAAGCRLYKDYSCNYYVSASALAHLGRQTDAEAAMAEALRVSGGQTLSNWKAATDYGGSEGGQRYFAGMIKAGLPE